MKYKLLKNPFRTIAIIPCAGKGKRLGGVKKSFIKLAGLPILVHTLKAFEECSLVHAVVVAVRKGDMDYCKENIVKRYGFKKVAAVVHGGKERQSSVWNALKKLKDEWDFVVIHDGVRPFVTAAVIKDTLRKAYKYGSGVASVKAKDTIKEIKNSTIKKTIPRDTLISAQTPQAFEYKIIKSAYEKAFKEGFIGTDDSSFVERLGVKVRVAKGAYENIKITTAEDIIMGECILRLKKVKKS